MLIKKAKKNTNISLPKIIFNNAFKIALGIVLVASFQILPIDQAGLISSSYQCGSGSQAESTSIDFGCKGDACVASSPPAWCSQPNSPIIDLLFSIIRFLSDGVGLVVIASIVYGGIQYTTAGGDPQNVAKAIKRIRSSITALIFFIFIYAILNYLLPAGFFKS